MAHKLGVYFASHHGWQSSWDYIARLQPVTVRILMPGDAPTDLVSRVHRAAPAATIALRWWDVDDGGEGNKRGKLADPERAAEQDAISYRARIETMEQVAKLNGLPFPLRRQLRVNGLNEPPSWEHDQRAAIVRYNVTLLRELKPYQIAVYAGCLAVGHPEEWPPVWDWARPIADAIRQSPGSAFELHEYWQLEGPNHIWDNGRRADWGALAGRYQHCPFSVSIVIGECGADGRLYDRKPQHTGWAGNMTPEQYAAQLGWYLQQINQDARIVAALPFLTDYQADEWGSFDTTGAHEAILQMVNTVHLPIVVTPEEPEPVAPDANWERAIAWILRWEGGFQNDPADIGNYYQGRLIGTKYGISAAAWAHLYDIPNLTIEQAKNIYFQHYWLASGADKYDWPLCLAHFDTAVNAGIGRAQEMMGKSGGDFLIYMGHLISWYTRIPNFEDFGRAWIRRRAELLLEASK